tara:strand:+ start:762 stop:944 length:183 start_codon:yes stop_codon:yes gene_type:complete
MAVPRRKISRSKRDHRRGHIKIAESGLSKCNNCGSLIRPHRVCPECGFYKGVEVIEVKAS